MYKDKNYITEMFELTRDDHTSFRVLIRANILICENRKNTA